MIAEQSLAALRAVEARLIARRRAPADPSAAVAEAVGIACGAPLPADLLAVGRAIAAAVAAHGASFAPRHEPRYHDRHHQAEAALAAGWLAGAARDTGLLGRRQAGLCVVAMAGHDLLHDGGWGGPPGALERRSAELTVRLAASLAADERAEIARLVLVTDPATAPPEDLAGRLMREADLFGSLTPCLGWRLSHALAAEWAEAGDPTAGRVATYVGRFALLSFLPAMTPPAVSLGLAAGRALQLAALQRAGEAASPALGAAALDAAPRDEADRRWKAALRALGLPALPP